jgi:hypothetical protein
MPTERSAKRARDVAGPRFNRRVSAFIRVRHEFRRALPLFLTNVALPLPPTNDGRATIAARPSETRGTSLAFRS